MKKILTLIVMSLMIMPVFAEPIDIGGFINSVLNSIFAIYDPCSVPTDCPDPLEYCYIPPVGNGFCQARKDDGEYCTHDTQCLSGRCESNFCYGGAIYPTTTTTTSTPISTTTSVPSGCTCTGPPPQGYELLCNPEGGSCYRYLGGGGECNGDGICGEGESYESCSDCIITCEDQGMLCENTCFDNQRIFNNHCELLVNTYYQDTEKVINTPRQIQEGSCVYEFENCGTQNCVVTGVGNPRCLDNGCNPPCADKCEDGKAYKQAYCKDSILNIAPTCDWSIVQDCDSEGKSCYMDEDGFAYCDVGSSSGSYNTCKDLCIANGFDDGQCGTTLDFVFSSQSTVYKTKDSMGKYECGPLQSCFCWGQSDVDKIWDFVMKYWKTILLAIGVLFVISILFK